MSVNWSASQKKAWADQRLDAELREGCARALADLGVDNATPSLAITNKPELAGAGDYQLNNAFALAKALKKAPNALAQELAAAVSKQLRGVAAATAVGGFVNIRLLDAWLMKKTLAGAEGSLFGVAPDVRAIVDYSSPNCAKRMHAGHLRSTVIGDAICALLEKSGASVTRVNHLGDWGTPFGVIIEQAQADGVDLRAATIAQMEAVYKRGSPRFKEDAAFAQACRASTAALQAGQEPQAGLWRTIRDKTLDEIQSIYDLLGIGLSKANAVGESFYQPMIPETLKQLAAAGVVRESEGVLAFFGSFEAPLLLAKSQASGGGYLYGATDAAALKTRAQSGANLLVYVVDERQSEHFKLLFELGEKAGWLGEGKPQAVHAPFGMMLDATGKPFKTRSGEAFALSDLVQEAIDRARALAREKAPDAPEAKIQELGRQTGVGALKYGDLSRTRTSAVKFDLDALVSLEGDTAPYLQYARVRAYSILQKAVQAPVGPDRTANAADFAFANAAERKLALEIARAKDGAIDATVELMPHLLCERLYGLTQAMNAFYAHCPVIDDATGLADPFRVRLCEGVDSILSKGLSALGIESPTSMPKSAPKMAL